MKKLCVFVGILFAFAVTGIMVNAKQSQMQKELAKEVLRFHVLANSDSKEDQALKMQVKERVLSYMREELPDSDSVDMTKNWVKEHLQDIADLAKEIVCKNGYEYQVTARVAVCDFPEKTYGDITFPSGKYDALRIEIGEAKGQNWWCVLYPNLCFLDAVHAVVPEKGKKELKKVLHDDTYEMVTTTSRFKIGWYIFK